MLEVNLINPAATAFLSNNTFTGMYVNQFGLAEYYTLGFSHSTKNGYHWGIHGLNLSVNDIFERPDLDTRRDSIRALVTRGFNSFNTRESALIINLSKSIEYNLDLRWRFAEIPLKIPFGINIKLLQKDLYQVKGIGLIFGNMNYTIGLDYSFSNHDLGNAHRIGGTIYL